MATRSIVTTTLAEIEAAGGADAFAEDVGGALLGVTIVGGIAYVEILDDPSSTGEPGEVPEEIPEGANQAVFRDEEGNVALFTLSDRFVIDDVNVDVIDVLGFAGPEIDGTSTLTLAQQHLGPEDNVQTARSCYVHNSADETAAVVLSIPWDLAISAPGATWEIVVSPLYSGVLSIDRLPKTFIKTAAFANGVATVTVDDTSNMEVGGSATVSGTGIPASTEIESIDSATQITLTELPTGDGPQELTFSFGKKGTINDDTAAVTVSGDVSRARVTISVGGTDSIADMPAVRIEGDLAETSTLLGTLDCNGELVVDALLSGAVLNDPLDCDGKLVTDALLAGATLNDNLNANGKDIYGIVGPPLTVNGVLTSAHSNRPLLLDGNATIPGTAGWYGLLEAVGGSRTVTFNSLTRVLASGDVMTILVKSASTYIMFHQLSANRATFA